MCVCVCGVRHRQVKETGNLTLSGGYVDLRPESPSSESLKPVRLSPTSSSTIQQSIHLALLPKNAPGERSVVFAFNCCLVSVCLVCAQAAGLQSDLVFAEIGRRIRDAGPALVQEVKGVFSWDITAGDGKTAAQWSK